MNVTESFKIQVCRSPKSKMAGRAATDFVPQERYGRRVLSIVEEKALIKDEQFQDSRLKSWRGGGHRCGATAQKQGVCRKALILPSFASFCQLLPQKKDVMSRLEIRSPKSEIHRHGGGHRKKGDFIGFLRKPLILTIFNAF